MYRHLIHIANATWIYCFIAVISNAYALGNDIVARVTDIQGNATETSSGIERNLRILARIKDGAIIRLEKGSEITLHFSAKRKDMRFVGPGVINVIGQSANSSNGVASTKEHKDIGISLDLSGSGLGGIIARGINPLKPTVTLNYPVKTKVIADRPLSLSWSTEDDKPAMFSVSLQQIGGPVLFKQSTTANQIRLPGNVTLNSGSAYEWSVVANSGGGKSAPRVGEFKVATASEASQFYLIYSEEKKSVSDWVLYALQLDEMKLEIESADVWQQLEAIRPGIKNAR